MTEENTQIDQNDEKEPVSSTKVDPFEELETEKERKRELSLEEKDNKQEDSVESKTSKKQPEKKKEKKEDVEEDHKEDSDEEEEEISETSELELLKKEMEKSKKSLLDAQKWGTKNSQKIKHVLKKLNNLIENSAFSEDEEKDVVNLKNMLESDIDAPFEEDKSSKSNPHPISKYVDMAYEKLGVMKELSDDPELFHKKYRAFEYSLLYDNKPDEIELLTDQLEELKDNPVKLAKKIMDIGEEYYNEYFKEFEESGGFRNIIEKRNKIEQKLKNEIDKLKKRLLNYEDFDKNPRYKVGEDHSVETKDEDSNSSDDPFDQVEREKVLKSRNRR